MSATNRTAYKRHAYSGGRKSLKRVRGGLRKYYAEESRLSAWRSAEAKKKPVIEQSQQCANADSDTSSGRQGSSQYADAAPNPNASSPVPSRRSTRRVQAKKTLDESNEDKLSVVCPKCKAKVEIHSPLFFVKPKEDEMLYIVAKVYHYLDQEYEDLKKAYADLSFPPLANILRRAALATGVTEERVVEILEKEKNAHVMCHPPKRRKVQSQSDNILPCEEGSSMNNEVDDEPSLNEPELTIEETVVVKMESQEVECVDTANTIQPIETVDVKQEPRDHDHNYTTKTLDQSSLGLNDSSNLTQKGIYNRTTTEIVIPRTQYALGFEPPPLVKMVPRPRNIQYDNISGPAPQVEPPPLVRLETRSRNIDYDTSLPPLGVEPPPLVQLNYDNTANRVSIETVDVKQEPRDHDYNNTFGTTTHQIGDITVETDGYLNTLNSALYVPSSTEKKAAEYSRSYRQRHRDEINERRRERRQRLKELEKISNPQNSEQINTTTSDNQDSLKKHTQRQQRYYERHREEINKRKRDKRRKHVSPSAPATPAERNRKYRERKKQEINERRRYSRIRQKYEQLMNRQANREESTSAFPSSDADDRIDQIFLEADPLRDREIKEEEIEIHEEGLR